MKSSLLVRAGALGLLALGVMAPDAARASSLCAGDFATSQVHPWPAAMTFYLPLRETSSTSGARIQAFRSSLEKAGLTIDPQGRATLQVVFTIRGGPGPASVFNDMNWQRRPTDAALLVDPSLPGATLHLTVIVSDRTAYQQIWVATMECRIETPDTAALAADIGTSLGKAIASAMRQR